MSQDYYILKTLNLKDENIHFYEEYVKEEFINKKRCLVFQAYLSLDEWSSLRLEIVSQVR